MTTMSPRLPNLYAGLDRLTAFKIYSEYPDGASLSPAPESMPPTPLSYPEMSEKLATLNKLHAFYNEQNGFYQIQEARLDLQAKMLEEDYRGLCSRGWGGRLSKRRRKLEVVLARYRENRTQWMAHMSARGYIWGSSSMEHQECRRAYKVTGLVHFTFLQERLLRVQETLRDSEDGEWVWKKWDRGQVERFYGIEVEDEDEYFDVDEEWAEIYEMSGAKMPAELKEESVENPRKIM